MIAQQFSSISFSIDIKLTLHAVSICMLNSNDILVAMIMIMIGVRAIAFGEKRPGNAAPVARPAMFNLSARINWNDCTIDSDH